MLIGKDRQVDIGLLMLRVGIGAFMMVHGIQKIIGFSDAAGGFPDPLGVGNQLSLIMAIGAEAGCSALLVLGLFTRIAAMPLAFTMVIACFVVHGGDPWKVKELAAVYLFVYVIIIVTGPGQLSLDQRLFGKSGAGGAS